MKEEPDFDDEVIKITQLPAANHHEPVSNKRALVERPLFERENKMQKTLLKVKQEKVEKSEPEITVLEVPWKTIAASQIDSNIGAYRPKLGRPRQHFTKYQDQILLSHSAINYIFKCEQCPRVFVSHMAMKNHSKVHGGKCKFVRLQNKKVSSKRLGFESQ